MHFHFCNVIYSWLDIVETAFLHFYIKADVSFILITNHDIIPFFLISSISLLLCKIYLFFFTISNSLLLYYSILKNSAILIFLTLCIKSFVIFIIIVSIRIATPRFKIESLTKIGWLYCLLFILICLLMFIAGYFFF